MIEIKAYVCVGNLPAKCGICKKQVEAGIPVLMFYGKVYVCDVCIEQGMKALMEQRFASHLRMKDEERRGEF